MHIFTDPADGETYVSAYCGMDIAHRVFACFDQNDLKAPDRADRDGRPGLDRPRQRPADDRRRRATGSSRPPRRSRSRCSSCAPARGTPSPGTTTGCRAAGTPARSLAADLDRDADELRRTTDAVLDHLATLFTEPYPFDSCDQIFVPGLNWGAQENPGCVTYRDEMLPRERTSDHLRGFRATVIAHEQAHMWFGNLVTMRWFEDTWLQESFADYLGYRVADDGAGFVGAQARHEIGRKPEAYVADERRSTHPVAPLAEQVPDVDAALANFDSISYAKGNSVLRQLATWLGDEAFLAGRQPAPDPAPVRERHPGRLPRGPRRHLRPRRAGLGRGLAADRRVRHRLRSTATGDVPVLRARRGPAPPLHRRRVRRPDAAAWRAAGRRGRGPVALDDVGRRGRGAQRARRVVRAGPPRRAVRGRRGDVPLGRRGRPGADGAVGGLLDRTETGDLDADDVPRAGGAPPPPRDRPHRRGRRRPPRPRAGGPAARHGRRRRRGDRAGGGRVPRRPRPGPGRADGHRVRRGARRHQCRPGPAPAVAGRRADRRGHHPRPAAALAGAGVGWRSSAPPTRTRSRRPGPPTAPPRPSWARRGRSPPARRRRPRRPPGWR